MTDIEKLKVILLEDSVPFFTDAQLEFYYEENGKNLNDTAYHCLILKAENTSLSMSGLNTSDSSKYFLRLARQYKPRNTGILSGG